MTTEEQDRHLICELHAHHLTLDSRGETQRGGAGFSSVLDTAATGRNGSGLMTFFPGGQTIPFCVRGWKCVHSSLHKWFLIDVISPSLTTTMNITATNPVEDRKLEIEEQGRKVSVYRRLKLAINTMQQGIRQVWSRNEEGNPTSIRLYYALWKKNNHTQLSKLPLTTTIILWKAPSTRSDQVPSCGICFAI